MPRLALRLAVLVLLAACAPQAGAPPTGVPPATGSPQVYPLPGGGPAATATSPAYLPPPTGTPAPSFTTPHPGTTPLPRQATPTAGPTLTPTSTAIPFVDLVSFSEPELGLAFKYPAGLGMLTVTFGSGETGADFRGEFSNSWVLYFRGISPDYSAPRGGDLSGTQGYFYDTSTGSYYLRFVRNSLLPITPARLLSVGDEVVVLLDENSSPDEQRRIESNQIAALINLKGERFPGLLFSIYDTNQVPVSTFEAILNTLAISKPAS